MSADAARLTERPVWDSSGMERIPFDGRVPGRSDARIDRRHATSKHGPDCSANPEVGCVCGYDPGEELAAGEVKPGAEVYIYGDVPVTILETWPVSGYSSPWVGLRYQWASDVTGKAMTGRLSLPASQRLAMVE